MFLQIPSCFIFVFLLLKDFDCRVTTNPIYYHLFTKINIRTTSRLGEDHFVRIENFRDRKISIFRCKNCIKHLKFTLGAKFYYLSTCINDLAGVQLVSPEVRNLGSKYVICEAEDCKFNGNFKRCFSYQILNGYEPRIFVRNLILGEPIATPSIWVPIIDVTVL